MSDKKRFSKTLITLAIILFVLILFSICLDKYDVGFFESFSILFKSIFRMKQTSSDSNVNIVLNIRFPRIIGAVLVGAALSVSGCVFQGIYRNPLVSPDLLGISSGAYVGIAIAILLSLSSFSTVMFAFIGGIIAIIITSLIPKIIKNRSNIMLILSGIVVGSLMSSILGFLKFINDSEGKLASITYWTMGSFSNASFNQILPLLLILIPSIAILILLSWWIDVVSIGENEATSLGANTRLIKTIVIVCATFLTSGSVYFAGSIGWIGLIIPHLSRRIVGTSNRKVIPVSALIGAIFMLIVDTIIRSFGIIEMPISIMTGIIGVPFFIWLILKRKDSIL